MNSRSAVEDQAAIEGIRSMNGDRQQFRDGEMERGEYLETLTKHGLEATSAEYLENMLSPDFVLSKITKAEKEEMRWLVRQQAEKIKAMHPPKRSPVQGDRMRALVGDENAKLQALDDRQIQLIEMAVFDVFFRVARSVEGWQQQELSSQYNVSRVDSDREESGGRLRGLFS